ncbi:MAG: MarR family transcriptional regulator [Lachnospiraceae bacterium]|nr:MarR family transcriptional regulator [Lachnospiraceae bacterium]MDD5854686.1 MarR family transcriptional regulator [Lachnospiraceae bacterium]
MSRQSSTQLNELLVRLFNHVMTAEGKAIITEEFKDISNNDMHIIEAVGIKNPQSVSMIARTLGVTVGTLTVNMNNLEKKGYLSRTRSKEDRRVVLVELTEKGRKAFFHHRDFHKGMIKAAVSGLNEDETISLITCLQKLEAFFENWS